MISSLYPVAFIASTALLIAWTFFQRQRLWTKFWRACFFMSFLAYLLSFLSGPGTFEDKSALLFRDMMLLGTIGLVFQFLVRNTGSFLVGLMVTAGGLIYLYESEWFSREHPETGAANTISIIEESLNNEFAIDGELLVELAPNLTQEYLSNLLREYQVNISIAFSPADKAITELDDYYLIDVLNNQQQTINSIIELLNNSVGVDWVEGNEEIEMFPLISTASKTTKRNFDVNDPELRQLWGFEAMDVDLLYGYLNRTNKQPVKQAVIAILDTGVDGAHEDLKENYITTQKKYDRDTRMHGTHCAGIAASVSNNGLGIASFSPRKNYLKVTGIKVLSDLGMGTQQTIIKGMIEAADKGVDVISMSLGGRSTQARQAAYRKAVEYANAKGAIVVAAAGNSNADAKDFSPVNTPGVIGVSAIDEQLDKAHFSNFVSNIKMKVAAPGVNIYSTTPKNSYASFNGTSMATPYVAGLIGLMKAFRPELDTRAAYRILTQTGKNTNAPILTGKLIQPYLAVKAIE